MNEQKTFAAKIQRFSNPFKKFGQNPELFFLRPHTRARRELFKKK